MCLTLCAELVGNSKQQPQLAEQSDNSRWIDQWRKRGDDPSLRSGWDYWPYLPGTEAEALQIGGQMEARSLSHRYLTLDAGSEESFKQLSGSTTPLIHLATHGFFRPDLMHPAEPMEQLTGAHIDLFGSAPFTIAPDPLLRSGLILSGANDRQASWRRTRGTRGEDGVLTAAEISRMNLAGTSLVVLSACETGLGEAQNSEGVFGLQRAFKLAGVESLVMSLWKVPDAATASLMASFYERWLAGVPKQQAFRQAQQKLRREYSSPYYWAAFVMMD